MAALLALLAVLAWWLARGEGGTARIEAEWALAVSPPEASTLAPASLPMDLVPEAVQVAPDLAPPPVAAPAGAHRVHDGLVSLDDDGLGMSGSVLDVDGRPVAEARLVLVEEFWGRHGDLHVSLVDRDTADADGRFHLELESLLGVEELRLFVTAPGHAPWLGRVAPVGDGRDIVLGAVQPMRLQLTFADGGPAAGAEVRWEDPMWGLGGMDGDLAGIPIVGTTDSGGWITLPVPAGRRDVSLVIVHDLHVGRHLLPFESWRAAGATTPQVLTLPRGAALEVLIDGWTDEVLDGTPFVSLSLQPYQRRADGTLELVEETPLWSKGPERRVAHVAAGRAVARDLEAPAYLVKLWSWGDEQLLNACWTPVPGTTTWHATSPRPSGYPRGKLRVEFVAEGGALPEECAWTLEAWDGETFVNRTVVTDLSQPTTLLSRFGAPVTLRVPELGEEGTRSDVPPSGDYRFVVDVARLQSMTGSLRIDLSAIAPPPRADEVRVSLRREGEARSFADARGLEMQGIPAGRYFVFIRARGAEDQKGQDVVIEAGRTSVLVAQPDPQIFGCIRGRVTVHGDDGWMRLAEVRLRDSTTGAYEHGLEQLGLQSFAIRVVPGSYEGEVIVGRLASTAARAERYPDVTMLKPSSWNAPSLVGRFTAEVRLGEITDVVVEVDATQLATVHVTAPATVPADDPSGAGWYVEALDPAGQRVAIAWFGSWSAEGVTLRLQPGRYTLSACHGPAASPPPAWTAEIEVLPDAKSLEVQLAPPVSD